MSSSPAEILPRILFGISVIFFAVLYGMWAWDKQWFPANMVVTALVAWKDITEDPDAKLMTLREQSPVQELPVHTELMQPGNTLITAKDRVLKAAVLDAAGQPIQEWAIDFHKLWPDADHVPKRLVPKGKPGTHIHGAAVLDNGDLVFNFEFLGMLRLNPCNEVVWRLPYMSHHSLHIDDEGMIWASGRRVRGKASDEFPRYKPPFYDPTIIKVSPDGEMLLEKSVMRLIKDNGLNGILYPEGGSQQEALDTLHLNDVETYDQRDVAGVFEYGDVMISLRHASTVLVFDKDWNVKQRWSAHFTHQHDPDFIGPDTVSVYDNNTTFEKDELPSSKIIVKNFKTGQQDVRFEGTEELQFYSRIMGKHQWLPNGNILVAESTNGRAFELTPDGQLAWQYLHINSSGRRDILEQVERLPVKFDTEFFASARAACGG
jgi:hypothetical protein